MVTNSGDFDGTFVYTYDAWKIAQVNDGSGNMVQQFIAPWTRRVPLPGTVARRRRAKSAATSQGQAARREPALDASPSPVRPRETGAPGVRVGLASRVDELVMMRAKDRGDLYVHQDANWNVIAATDMGGSVVERYVYTPYGELTAHQVTAYGDRDGDGTVDSADKGTPGTTCTGTVSGACRLLDLDFDGDYDSADATLFDNLPQGLARHPGRIATGVQQFFAYQGLQFEREAGSYHNRARQYDPRKRRFLERDQLGLGDPRGPVRPQVVLMHIDGMSSYAYLTSNAIVALDPRGTWTCSNFSNGFSMVYECCGGTVQECEAAAQPACCQTDCPSCCQFTCIIHADSDAIMPWEPGNDCTPDPDWGPQAKIVIYLSCDQICSPQ